MTTRRERFVRLQIAWMLGTLLLLVLFDALRFELVFVASFVGFLLLIELTAPIGITPKWRTRLRWIVVLGVFVFAYLVVEHVDSILPSGVF